MLISAELRWFWRGSLPSALEAWFRSGALASGGGKLRNDEYLMDPLQRELGIKKRSGRAGIEIKGLVEVRARLLMPLDGCVQVWTKWTSKALTIDHLPRLVVQKTRWLRKFDTSGSAVRELELDADERLRDEAMPLPEQGCHVELVDLSFGNEPEHWSTFGFEAFGPLNTVERSLQRTIASMAPLGPDALAGGLEMSYPEWLVTASVRRGR
jgi:hypothetical protein